MRGRCSTSGRDKTRSVMETICKSFEPVVVEIFWRIVRISIGVTKMTYTGFNPAVIQDCSLQPWDEEVGAFTSGLYCMVYEAAFSLKRFAYLVLYTRKTVKHDCPETAWHIVDTGLRKGNGQAKGHLNSIVSKDLLLSKRCLTEETTCSLWKGHEGEKEGEPNTTQTTRLIVLPPFLPSHAFITFCDNFCDY